MQKQQLETTPRAGAAIRKRIRAPEPQLEDIPRAEAATRKKSAALDALFEKNQPIIVWLALDSVGSA